MPTLPNPWNHLVGLVVPRVLSSLDREPFSATYGCFDRTFWCWKFVDHPGARFQEAVATLSYLATAPGRPRLEVEHYINWCAAGIRYWSSLQHGDGSFDEAYPFERSLAATAFTSFYVGEAIERLGDLLPSESRELGLSTIARAASWLGRNDESHGVLSNHLAAAAAASEVAFRLCDDRSFALRRDHFVDRVLTRQSTEGWYDEYGGADPGYQTHGSYYLARIWQQHRDERLLASLRRATDFLAWMVHPDGSIGGEHGSRNTEFAFPAAFEILAPEVPSARAIAASLRRSIPGGRAVSLLAMDRWNLLPMANNLLAAAHYAAHLEGDEDGALPCYGEASRDFPDAGIAVRSTPRLWVVVGLSKGGVVRCFDRATLAHAADAGWWAGLSDGEVASSQSLDREAGRRCLEIAGAAHQAAAPSAGDSTASTGHPDALRLEVPFVKVNQRLLDPWSMLAFRLTTLTIGRLPSVARFVKRLLVRVLVRRRQTVALTLERTITIGRDEVRIDDCVVRPRRARSPIALGRGSRFATIHMGSSRYASAADLTLDLPGVESERLAFLARDGSTTATRVLRPTPPQSEPPAVHPVDEV